MSLLLDTHIAIWSVSGTGRLPAAALDLLRLNAGETYVSSASLLEIAIKHTQPRRDPPPFNAETALRFFVEAGHRLLELKPQHAVEMERLPALHADPFDRMLIAQALAEGMQFLTMDRLLARYHPTVVTF